MRYAREKIDGVDEDDGGGDEEKKEEDDDDGGETPTNHLLTFLAPASHVRTTTPGFHGDHCESAEYARSRSGPGTSQVGQVTVYTGDADTRGRRDDPRPQPAAQRRCDAVIRRSATGDRGGGSVPPRIIIVVVVDGGDDVLASGGICPTLDRGRIVPETTAGITVLPGASHGVPFGNVVQFICCD